MKKLLTVLMISGLFGFASCGNSEQATENATTDTTAVAPEPVTEEAPAVDTTAVADTATNQ